MQPDLTKRTKVLACATVIEEMLPVLPEGVDYEVLDFGLHLVPDNLKAALQAAIDKDSPNYDTIILGYGLCSMAVVGLHARESTLVVPRVDDCIALFLGSRETYSEMAKKEPGTYYLTKGWIKVGDTILDEYHRAVERYGEARANRIMSQMFRRYTRMVFIDTGQSDQDYYRAYVQRAAAQFNLRFEEVKGADTYIKKMLFGPWDSEFVIAQPGEKITYLAFTQPEPTA